ncbi:PREDICTED: TAF5-like RNA polymerase II p300/CBP-associated factor-associated factor 65 kDa subunit 5L isoform X1 [Amphimedon queenslandica]|uniref:TFIID subunit TAF5 NTD2 domain-containing protein n=3 Tax=Amphimedon queenslandica TaxID=400682 RepID=A0A1X7VE07_AMPQE|nr:PREDICTED: TAF5-like RNA polymerase II p300/CBP-associated factor-associated factor 65 kDa subunit 5L isoform X1 [Amphimedon queenslandica]|eukprot:XP_019849552.1 PREDICTED: TAF5-like RNA polymerase II p300/CBP-associated factor-associated factor 65 kDa subunit 5L isoform X1 [Amphimedon queenslandica]
MSSISSGGSGSVRGEKVEEIWQNVQDTLREQRYPSHAHFPVVQSLKDLVNNSVHIETSGDPLVTAWTAQPGGSKDIQIGFQSFIDYLLHETDSYKTELLNSLVYPLFVHCYVSLVSSNETESAKRLYADTSHSIDSHCVSNDELQQLLSLTSAASLQSSPLVEKYRSGKYFVRLSELAFTMLMSFLQAHPTTALLNIIHKHFSIEVFGCKVSQPTSEQKMEGKKTSNFIKPKIEVLPESDFSLSSFPRPPIPPPLPPFVPTSTGEEALAAKHDFQSKLTGATQQLEPSIPSLLLCIVQATENTWVQCASLSSWSKEYACGLDDSSVVISSWLPRSTESESVLSLKGHHGPVHGLSYSPNGQFLLSSSEDTTVRLWNTSSHSPVAIYEGHSYPVWDVSFSSVDGYFTTASYDRTARLWNTDRVYPLRIFAGHEDSTDVVHFHPNGSYIATGSKDHTSRLWDINTGNCVRLFPGSKSPITVIAFSPFGKQVATATNGGTITLWDLGMSRIDWEVKAHTRSVTSLAYSCDGTLLASTSEDKTIKLWNMKAVLVNTANSGSTQGLISTQSTGDLLPLHVKFTHRNSLIVIGVSHNGTASGGAGTQTNDGGNTNTNNNILSPPDNFFWRSSNHYFYN